jgi:hypothetical protein
MRRIIVVRHEWDEPMSRRPIGEAAMSDAERARRRRAKAKAQAEANGKQAGATAEAARPPPAAVPDLLAGNPEVIAARIFERVSVDTARGIAMALQQRLWQGGSWPAWAPPIL